MGTVTVKVTDASGNVATGSAGYTVTQGQTTARFPGDPGQGKILWGYHREGGVSAIPARAAQYQAILGKPAPVYPGSGHVYMTSAMANVAGANAAMADANTLLGWGVYPLIDIKEAGGTTFAQVGTGALDAVFDTLITGFLTAGKPGCLSYHNEPAGDGIGGAAEYGQALARLRARRDALGAQNLVSVTGALGIGSFAGFGGGNGDPLPWLQAIDPYVTVWNMHRYLQAIDTSPASLWKTAATQFTAFWDLVDGINPTRAKFVGEWGVHTRATDPTFATKYMDDFYNLGLGRNLAVAQFFDSGQNSANSWVLDLGGENSRLVKMANQQVYPTSAHL